jgi:replicative DNA helicase
MQKTNKLTAVKAVRSELGKLPPQAIELEEAVLGAIMLERDALTEVMDILSPDSFYKDENQEIYRAAREVFNDQKPIDVLTMAEHLKKNGKLEMVGGRYNLARLTSLVGSSANIQYHARIVQEKFILRQLIAISGNMQTKAFDPQTDVFELLDETENAVLGIAEGNFKSQGKAMSLLVVQAIAQLEEMSNKPEGLTGVGSGFTDLDKVTSGWQPSDLIIIAARPGMGKTAFVLGIARNAAVDYGVPVAVFSLEMASLQLVNRLISAEANIDAKRIRNGQLLGHEIEELHKKIDKLGKAEIYIDDTPALNIFDLRSKARRLREKYKIGLIIIDYLQLMSGMGEGKGFGNTNREQEISKISRSLKGLAKDLGIPVIALSQLSRAVETRSTTSKRPMLSDLRESGSIEQDADQVIFLYRPEYYGLTVDENNEPVGNMAEVIIAKNRHGETPTIKLVFTKEFAKFANPGDYTYSDLAQQAGDKGYIIRSSVMNQELDDPIDPTKAPF